MIFQRFALVFIVVMGVLFVDGNAAKAQNTDVETAAEIAATIDGWIARQAEWINNPLQLDGTRHVPMRLDVDGRTSVTPENGHYAAKLPFLALRLQDGHTVELGQLALNISPEADNKDHWLVTAAFPHMMNIMDGSGASLGAIEVQGQRFKGILDTHNEMFLKYEARYESLKATGLSGVVQGFEMRNFDVHQDLTPDNGNADRYSGPLKYSAENITMKTAGDYDTAIYIDRAEGETQYHSLEIFNVRKWQEETIQRQVEDPENVVSSLVLMLVDVLRKMPEGVESRMNLSGVNITGRDALGNTRMAADRIYMTSFGRNMQSNNAESGSQYAIEGIRFEGMPDTYAGYLPTHSTFRMDISDIPAENIINFFENYITNVSEAEVPPEASSLIQPIIALLAENGTQVTIHDAQTVAPEFGMKMSGQMRASAESPRVLVGDITFQIRGMDKAIQGLNEVMRSTPERRLLFQQMILGLTIAQTIGQSEDGGESRTYRITLTEDGRFLLNGMPMDALFNTQAH